MKFWTTEEGKIIKITDMDDDHLTNTIKYLRKRIKEFKRCHYPCFSGEQAQYYAEQEYERSEELYFRMIDMKKAMEKEYNRRKDV